MDRRRLLPVALFALLAAGCGGGGTSGPGAGTADIDSGATVGADAGEAGAEQSCENPVDGWAVTFPGDWYTNTTEVLDACSVFDPQPITLPEASEIPADLAIVIRREERPFADATSEDPAEERVSSEEATVAGRPALRVEVRATGQGLLDAGTVTYRYYVDGGDGSTIVAQTHDVEGTDFERNRRVLDDMMESLELF